MKDVYILAVESSCDETSVSIIKNGYEDIATIINTQIDVHTKYGGVVPEVASRLHLENITMVINECMEKANMKFEDIDAFSKLKLESKFQKLSPGGAISYIETQNLQNNLEVVLQVIQFIYDNIMYAELNTKSDYCQKCGFDGEILINDNLEWYCPNCGNKDHNTLNVARRTCGYIGSQFWNKGRTQEIKERVLHIDNKDDE